jgi:CheY-like chemotaxis protein
MMPGMDGVEATERIRGLGSDYAKNIPVIALTANAAVGNEQMFLEKGFQAFLSKPINIFKMDDVITKWIKRDGEEIITETAPSSDAEPAASPPAGGTGSINGVNMRLGRSLYEDDEEMFVDILQSFAENVPSEIEKLRGVTKDTLVDYAIDIHTVKGACASIGAKELSLRAKEMEAMAKAGDLSGVQIVNEQFIKDAEILVGNVKAWLGN